EEAAPLALPANVETPAAAEDNNQTGSENAGMPRRSRRSPRHLRVSGQRRRRYRDERYPTQSPMPLTVACASPEMASGKVWIRYPLPRVQEQEEQQLEQNTAPVAETQTTEAPVAPVANAVVVEPSAVESAPQETVVETTHPEAISTPVDAQPQIIEPQDEAVAEQVAQDAVAADAPVTDDAPREETAAVMAESAPEEAPQPEAIADEPVKTPEAAPVVEPKAQEAEVKAPVVAVASASVASAPMTRAPAPDYVPEPPRHSDWVRPTFDFSGKGSAGGHSATHQASAPATRPQPVE
ncbi:ribonuclease E, partial [Cronobacter turicensis]